MTSKRPTIDPGEMASVMQTMAMTTDAYLDMPQGEDIKSADFDAWRDRALQTTQMLQGKRSSGALGRLFRHNLNNHFTVILTAFELMRMKKDGDCSSVDEFRRMVVGRIGQVRCEVESLLFWAGALPDPEPVDLADFVDDMAPILENFASESGMEMEIQKPNVGHLVLMHRGTIASLLVNQVRNAKGHGGAKRTRLKTTGGRKFATLLLDDDGKGVDAESLPHIFEYGYSGNRVGGSGIGLADANERMAAMGGSIDCLPHGGINGGARFRMDMKRVKS